MAKNLPSQGWTASTFEVQTAKGSRWLTDMTSPKRSEAMERAEALMAAGNLEGVRVTEMRDTWSQEKVVFEKTYDLREKPLKIDPVPEVVLCRRVSEYYALPSRLVIGRILRSYLDRNGLTALELLFNGMHLMALDRMDSFFPSALQHVAQLQAKMCDQSKADRLDKLTTVFNGMLKRARKGGVPYEEFAAYAQEHGLDHALTHMDGAVDDKLAAIAPYGLMAAYIAGSTWREKFKLAIDLLAHAQEPRSIDLADEVIAEVLDGRESVEEIFGGFANAIDAWKTFTLITSGRFDEPPRHMSPDIARLSGLFIDHDLNHTREVLLRRISRGLGGTQALSKSGREADRASFIGLVRDLVEPAGLHGGPAMVEAVVLRAKSLLGEDGADLPIETAIRQAVYLMPSQAARLGMLLDLTSSELGRKYDGLVRQQLMHLLNALHNIYDLFPSHMREDERVQGIDSLRARLGMSALSDDLKHTLQVSLGRLSAGQEVKGQDNRPAASPAPAPAREAAPDAKPGEVRLTKGQVLFHEGEAGEEAYLVMDGAVEVYRLHNGQKQHLATLGKGEILGEMSLIDNQPRMASVCAAEDTVLMRVSQENLTERLDKLAANDKVLHFLLKSLVRRLRGLARITD